MKQSAITSKAIQAGIIWRSLGYKSAMGFCRNQNVPVALARLAAQLQAVKGI